MRRRRLPNIPAMVSRARGARVRGLDRLCLSFGGVNEYVAHDNIAPELAASQAWTVSFWLQHSGPTATGQNVWNINTAAGGNQMTSTFSGAHDYMTIYAGSSAVTADRANTTDLLDGEWHHLLIAVDHTADRLDWYVDGVLEQGTGASVFPALNADDLVTVGAEWDPGPGVGNFFGGQIMGLAVWFDVDDHAARAAALYAAGPSMNLRHLNAQPDRWWPYGGTGYTAAAVELMGSGDDGALNNFAPTDLALTGL